MAFHNRQLQPRGGVADIPFFTEHHGTDHPQIPAGQVAFGGKAAQLSTVKQVHKKGLYGIVKMVAQSQCGAAVFFCHFVKNPPTHPGAQAARIFLFPFFKDNGAQSGTSNEIGHIQFPAQLLDGGEVRFLPTEAGVGGNGDEGKRHGIKCPQFGKSSQEHQGVLSARHSHGDFVPGLYHFIPLHGGAHLSHQFLHGLSSSLFYYGLS